MMNSANILLTLADPVQVWKALVPLPHPADSADSLPVCRPPCLPAWPRNTSNRI